MQIALLHQTGPLLSDYRCRLPYYTRHTLGRQYPPQTSPTQLINPKCTEPLLHQRGPPNLINPRWRLPITPVRPPANLLQMEIALLHQSGPLLIYPRWRLPYYTRPAEPIQKWGGPPLLVSILVNLQLTIFTQ